MAIFQESIVHKHLNNLDNVEIDNAYNKYKEVYGVQKIENIKKAKEEQYQEGFIKDIFGQVLGYSIFPEQPFNIQTETKNATNSKKADGAIFQGENVVGVIELKDNKTRNLDAVKDQAFGYKNNHKDCSYVISSNFHKLRFYIDDATEYEEFDLYNLDKETFKRFYLYLRKEGLLDKDIPKLLRQETKFHEENITKSLYKDYSGFKSRFYENAIKNNPQFDRVILFKKSQKFLDKVLFVLFAEDKGLIHTNSIVSIVEKWQSLKEDAFDNPKPLYQLVNFFFGNLYNGKKDQNGNTLVPEFGGEIFAPDEVLDNITIDDSVIKDDLLKLSKYDFNTDVDVNILGHIFEHSLSEIEEVEASLSGAVADKAKGKRKKDGVFYTPKYITKYIVENTLGKLCNEKKSEFGLDADLSVFDYQKADGKLNAKGIDLFDKITNYKKWLMSLKVVDPACGSGAFLNQAVNFLIEEHKYFDDLIADLTNSPLRLFDTDIAILENNIYGVDINEESVEIAKLSLWLRTAKPGRKLTNLSSNIKCGNSLIDDSEVAGEKAFNWQKQFPEVFENGGFDVVIGNPPYVDIKALDKIIVKDLFKNYHTAENRINLYSIFIEKGYYILKDKGMLSFINPNSILVNSSYSSIRKFLISDMTRIVKLPDAVFEDATVETIIFEFQKNSNQKIMEAIIYNKHEKLSFIDSSKAKKVNKENWKQNDDYNFNIYITDEQLRLLNKMEHDSEKLVNIANFSLGITPYDKYQGHSEEIIKNRKFHSTVKINENYKPLITGENITRYFVSNYVNEYLHYGDWLGAPRDEKFFKENRIIVRQIVSGNPPRIFAGYTDEELYFTQIGFGIIPKEINVKYLIGILNSNLINFYHKYRFLDLEKDLFQKILIANCKALPIKIPTNGLESNIVIKVDLIIKLIKESHEKSSKFQRTLYRKFELKELPKKLQDWYKLSFTEFIKELNKLKVNLTLTKEAEWEDYFNAESQKLIELKSQIEQTEQEIDQIVYELYELSEEEIKIVQNS